MRKTDVYGQFIQSYNFVEWAIFRFLHFSSHCPWYCTRLEGFWYLHCPPPSWSYLFLHCLFSTFRIDDGTTVWSPVQHWKSAAASSSGGNPFERQSLRIVHKPGYPHWKPPRDQEGIPRAVLQPSICGKGKSYQTNHPDCQGMRFWLWMRVDWWSLQRAGCWNGNFRCTIIFVFPHR